MKRLFSKITAVIVAVAVVLSTMGMIDWLSISSEEIGRASCRERV